MTPNEYASLLDSRDELTESIQGMERESDGCDQCVQAIEDARDMLAEIERRIGR